MTVPAIEPMSAEEREYRGLSMTIEWLEEHANVPFPNQFNPRRRWTALECRLMAASNALWRVV